MPQGPAGHFLKMFRCDSPVAADFRIDVFSLADQTGKADRYTYARLPFRVDGTDFSFLPSLAIDNRAAANFKGKWLKEKLPDLTLSRQWKDEEIVLVLIE